MSADTAIDTSMYLRRQTLRWNEFIHWYSCDRDVRLCRNWLWSSVCERFSSSESLVQLFNLLLQLLLKLFVSTWLTSVSFEPTCCFTLEHFSHMDQLSKILLTDLHCFISHHFLLKHLHICLSWMFCQLLLPLSAICCQSHYYVTLIFTHRLQHGTTASLPRYDVSKCSLGAFWMPPPAGVSGGDCHRQRADADKCWRLFLLPVQVSQAKSSVPPKQWWAAYS